MKTPLSTFLKGGIALLLFSLFLPFAGAQSFTYPDAWSEQGFSLTDNKSTSITITHSITNFRIEPIISNGKSRQSILLPGTFLFNDAGAPNLPGAGRMIAIPTGARPVWKIVAQRTEVLHDIDIAPAPEIPLENAPTTSAVENQTIYGKNALYPASPVILSPVEQIRGIDIVTIGITPFQYNPVTRQLIVYRDLQIEISFEGGTGSFGEERLRSRWWDPLLSDQLLNFSSLPVIDYSSRMPSLQTPESREEGAEYLIIIPNNPVYAQWADSLKLFRTEQGITTKVVTLAEIGGNTSAAIESYVTNAYNTWTTPPAACLLLGDHGNDDTKQITSNVRNDHPGGYNPYVTDNPYADITGDLLPDICFARMPVNNADQVKAMVSRAIQYERNPPDDAGFYNHPIFALGWQTERWFQICQETVAGYLHNVKGKEPVRINEIYEGNPAIDPWSTAPNTTTILNFFGPSGLGYIPATPAATGIVWSGGTASMVNDAIMDGGFLLQHRDHGHYTCWGEPEYCTNNINTLSNTTNSQWPFLMSINCQTGSFNQPGECLVEKFVRFTKNGQNAGVLAGIGDSEVSYSYVNDTYTWGVYDNFWTDFMPSYGTTPPSRGFLPCFGNAAGKYFLKQSNWPYNATMKPITYQIFHFFGDAFQLIHDQLPQTLTVVHAPVIWDYETSFDVSADAGSLICLTLDGEIIGTATGTGLPVSFATPGLVFGQTLVVTVTKDHCRRYRAAVPVTTNQLYAVFSANITGICEGASVSFTDQSTGSPTSWEWTFEGGTPATSTEPSPTITYETPGTYSVTLTVSKTGETNTEVKEAYISAYPKPTPDFATQNPCLNKYCQFTDLTNPNGGTITNWLWYFGDPASGIFDSSDLQNPVHAYNQTGTVTITLQVTNNGVCSETLIRPLDILDKPQQSAAPTGSANLCQGATGTPVSTVGTPFATGYLWEINPPEAGTFADSSASPVLSLSQTFTGAAQIKVKGINACGEGGWSTPMAVTVIPVLPAPSQPSGPDTLDVHYVQVSDFTTTPVSGATSYVWALLPEEAGTLSGSTTTATITWNQQFQGTAELIVKAFDNTCEGLPSPPKQILVKNTLGMDETPGIAVQIYPNPAPGRFTVDVSCESASAISLQLYDLLGNRLYENTDNNNHKVHTITLDLPGVPAGLYYLKISTNSHQLTRPVILTH